MLKRFCTSPCLRAVFFCLLIFLLQHPSVSFAQIYPVEVMPMVAPPYPAYLADYAREDLTIQRMQVNILMRDLSQAHRRVRLKVYIDGPGLNVSGSDMPNNVEPLFLDGGATLRLTNAQLAPYFRVENLLGMSPQVYARPLFSGLYQFGFEVYDFATNNRLSARRNAMAQVVYNLPPLLNFPATGSEVSSAFPQNVMFNWTPRHADISATEYEFTMVELNDPMLQGEAAFAVSIPFYQQTTMATALVYGPAMPPLVQGKRYAWRVQVKSRMGAAYTPVFEHDGYSPVYTFTCESSTPAPVNLTAEPRERHTALATWKGQPEHTSYMIELRQKPGQEGGSSNWYQYTVTDTQYLFQNLRPGYAYECRVTGYRNQHNYATSETVEFATPAMNPPKFEGCGTTAQRTVITNRTPLEHLLVGDVFTAAGSPVTVVAVEETSGRAFSGTGWVKIPFLGNNKIKVKFTDIQINTDYQLIVGTVETTYDPQHRNIINVNHAVKQLAEDLATTFSELANAVSNRIEKFIASFEKEGVTQPRLDSLNTIVPKNIDKLIASAPAETKGLIEQAKQTYDEYYACLNEQAKSSTPESQPANNTKGPNPYGYMGMTCETRNCAEKGKQAVNLIEKAAAYTSNSIVCGCLTSTSTSTLNTNCSEVLKILNALKAANSANQEVNLSKISPAIQNAQVSIGKTCYENITVDMSLISTNNVSFSPSSYSVKQVGTLPENYQAIVYDKILSIKIPSTVKNAEEQIRQLELYLFGTNKATVKVTVIGDQLTQIFGTSKARCDEVAKIINKYSDKFEISTPERMAHFLGQIGVETGGLVSLKENLNYSSKDRIKEVYGNTYYCDLFEGYNCDWNSCGAGHPASCTPALSYIDETLKVKDKFVNSSLLADYVYSCRMGNGTPASGDGSKYAGKGFIHLTGKDQYKAISDAWNADPENANNQKHFDGADIDELTMNVETALKASMYYWKTNGLNTIANNGIDVQTIKSIGRIVNGKSSPNSEDLREEYSSSAFKILK